MEPDDINEDKYLLSKLMQKINNVKPKLEELTKINDGGMNIGMSSVCCRVRKLAKEILEDLK